MIDFSDVSSLALVGAFGLVSYQYFQFEKRYKKDQKQQKFENQRVLQALAEGKLLVEQLKAETARLQKAKANAQDVGDQLNVIISEAEAEAENSERITAELKVATKAGDRTCDRITDLVSAAADLHRAIKPALEEMKDPKSKPVRKNSLVRDRVITSQLPQLKTVGENVVHFPVMK